MLIRALILYAFVTTVGLVVLFERAPHGKPNSSHALQEPPSVGEAASNIAALSDRARLAADPCEGEPAGSAEVTARAGGELLPEHAEQIYRERQARELVDSRIADVKTFVSLDPAIEARLRAAYLAQELLNFWTDLSDDEDERLRAAIPSDEEILGKERVNEIAKLREQESKRLTASMNEQEVLFVSDVLRLTPEQESLLREHYSKPDHHVDVALASVVRGAGLRPEQRSDVRAVLAKDFFVEAERYINEAGDSLPDSLKFEAEGEMLPDATKVSEKLRHEELRKVMTEEQFNRYLEYEANHLP